MKSHERTTLALVRAWISRSIVVYGLSVHWWGSARSLARRGKPVILTVDAGRMHRDGHKFFVSANGVWLTDTVPPGYLSMA